MAVLTYKEQLAALWLRYQVLFMTDGGQWAHNAPFEYSCVVEGRCSVSLCVKSTPCELMKQ